jgi:3-oxoisoapionate kinase
LTGLIRSRPLYAYYGDDFTGSTDVLEALALHGVEAVLFTHVPERSELKAFAHCKAIGIAGESRSQSPRWMTRNLPGIFESMRKLGAAVNHYKVCSTFDSSAHIGNIGCAMEMGREVFKGGAVPVVVGAPHLKRFVVFGNLFAAENGAVHRIDRHPTMRQHPMTPMDEADLRAHLSKQTTLRIGSVDLRAFEQKLIEQKLRDEEADGAEAVIFDGIDDAMLNEAARVVWNRAQKRAAFAVGSSGLTYGLMHLWRKLGMIRGRGRIKAAEATDRLLVLSGSCSPVTARQIKRAQQQGFAALHLNNRDPWEKHQKQALKALGEGKSVLLYSAVGPQARDARYGEQFSVLLGKRLRELLIQSETRRVLIVGGDTSTHVVKQLGIDALTFAAPLVPGVPLCRCSAPGSTLNGLEMALKGGQIGPEDFFARVRDGRCS